MSTPVFLRYPLRTNNNISAVSKTNKGEIDNIEQDIVIFTPKIIDSSKIITKFKNALNGAQINDLPNTLKNLATEMANNDIADFSRKGFEKLLSHYVDENNNIVQISLPLKPISIKLSHSWSFAETTQGEFKGRDIIKTLGQIAGTKAIKAAAEKIGGSVFATGLSQAGGVIYTPQRQYYTGTTPISLAFSYDLGAKSREEANIIKKIIKTFQFLSTTQSPKEIENSALHIGKIPNLWSIKFIFDADRSGNGKTKNLITAGNEFKTMVCTDVDVQFSDGSWYSTFGDGFPTIVSLSLTFTQYFSIQSAESQFGYKNLASILNEKENADPFKRETVEKKDAGSNGSQNKTSNGTI